MSASECYVDGVLCNPYLELMVVFRILRLSHTGVQFQPIDFCIYDSEAEGEFLRHPSVVGYMCQQSDSQPII